MKTLDVIVALGLTFGGYSVSHENYNSLSYQKADALTVLDNRNPAKEKPQEEISKALQNDDFENATLFVNDAEMFGYTNNEATIQNQPGHLINGVLAETGHAGNPGGKSIWFKYGVSDYRKIVSIDTIQSDFDTIMAVYTKNEDGTLTEVVANDDIDHSTNENTSKVTFEAVPGTFYYIAVDGKNVELSGDYPEVAMHGSVNLTTTIEEIIYETPTPTPTPTVNFFSKYDLYPITALKTGDGVINSNDLIKLKEMISAKAIWNDCSNCTDEQKRYTSRDLFLFQSFWKQTQ